MVRSINYNSKYLYWITIFGIIIFNILQKISFLDAEPFWYDEIVSVKAALLDFGHIKHMSEWDNNPPFYYYSLWVWFKVVGISEFKARLLSVLCCTASACIVFVISKKYFNYKTALAAAFIFSLHNFVYAYAYEARAYSLVVLLVLISSYLFLNLLQSGNKKTIFFLGLVNFLVIYTHYIAGMVLLFQMLIILIHKRELIKPYFISLIICIILVFIRFTKKQVLLILSYEKGAETFWLKTADKGALHTAIVNLFSGTYIWPLLLILFIAAIARLIYLRKTLSGNITNMIYFSLTGSGSILLLYLVGIFKPIFLDRYLLFSVPFISIMVSWFIFNSKPFMQAVIIPVFFFQFISLNPNPQKSMDYRMAADVVKELRMKNQAMILLQTRDITSLFTYYYANDLFLNYKDLASNLGKNKVFEIENANDLNTLNFKDENTIIFCQTFEKAGDSSQIFDIFKQNNFVYATTKGVKGVRISLLKKIKPI